MNILIFGSSSTNRSPDQQAQAELLISLKHKVILLTLGEDDKLHKNFRALGAEAYSSAHVKGRSVFFFLKQAIYFAKFCKKHKIDVAFCHLHGNALIGGMAGLISKTKIIYVRHHTDELKVMKSKKDIWISKAANWVSPRIVAISEKVKQELLIDGVNPKKIYRINLCYNFDDCLASDVKEDPAMIRSKANGKFVLLNISRLIKSKRHLIAFEVVKKLNEDGFDCAMLCVGTGPMQKELEKWIIDNKMTGKIILEGFRSNIADYFKATDILLHSSYSEASNQVVKEAGMLKKTAIVCEGVGDFNNYLKNNINSYIVDKENPIPEMLTILKRVIFDKEELKKVGEQLNETVLTGFSIENVKENYVELLSEIIP